MPPAPPVAYATLSNTLPARPYILGITPSSSSPHLVLRHPSNELTIVDNQSLQPVDVLQGGHNGNITDVCSDGGALWSSAKDGSIVRWDERSRRPESSIKGEAAYGRPSIAADTSVAFLRGPLPVTAIAVSERDYMVIGGTELLSSEAHILFW